MWDADGLIILDQHDGLVTWECRRCPDMGILNFEARITARRNKACGLAQDAMVATPNNPPPDDVKRLDQG